MAQITKDTIIGDILDIAPETAPIFLSIGMHTSLCILSSYTQVMHSLSTSLSTTLVNKF